MRTWLHFQLVAIVGICDTRYLETETPLLSPDQSWYWTHLHLFAQCRMQQQEAARSAQEARLAAEWDHLKNRALTSMMNNTLQRKKEGGLELLVRQAWMDTSLKDMTKQQRQQLKEFDRKVQEYHDGLESIRRISEGERKGLEEEILVAISAFHKELRQLHFERMDSDMALAVLHQQQLSLAGTMFKVSSGHVLCWFQTCRVSTAHLSEPLLLLLRTGQAEDCITNKFLSVWLAIFNGSRGIGFSGGQHGFISRASILV
jgi:hypothetical protein